MCSVLPGMLTQVGAKRIASLWYGKEERRSLAEFRFDPDASTMALDTFFAQGQANASARVAVPRMQTLKDDKNPLSVLWCYTDAVIAH